MQERQADEETKEWQRTPQREREEAEEPATSPQPAGRGPPDTDTCGVPQRERSRTMAEAPEPPDPEPQNRKLQDPQSQAQKGHQEDRQTLREEEQTGPQSYSIAEECKRMDQAGGKPAWPDAEPADAKPEGPAAELNGAEADAEESNGGSETVKGRKRGG